jgi:hypothetical protein
MTPTTDLPCCGNCTTGHDKCPQYNDDFDQLPFVNHPHAREYLNRDVIALLETLKNDSPNLIISKLNQAIEMLKGDVK